MLLADRKEAELTAAVRGLGARAAAFVADVTDPAAAKALADDCVARWGGLDICVCNAGVIRAADFLDLTLEDLDAVMNVNVRGTFLVAQAAARAMVAGGRQNGAIVTLSSMTAGTGDAGPAGLRRQQGGGAADDQVDGVVAGAAWHTGERDRAGQH